MSKPNLPPLPKGFGTDPTGGPWSASQMRAYAEEAVRQALAELVPVGCCMATADGYLHMFSSMRAADKVGQRARNLRQKMILLYVLPETRDG